VVGGDQRVVSSEKGIGDAIEGIGTAERYAVVWLQRWGWPWMVGGQNFVAGVFPGGDQGGWIWFDRDVGVAVVAFCSAESVDWVDSELSSYDISSGVSDSELSVGAEDGCCEFRRD